MTNKPTFGQRSEPHTIIIARGKSVRHFTVRPWMFAITASLFLAISLGYIVSTTYMIFRDDLINASIMRQAQIQHAYEDRISTLRSQVDRITSHRLLDQQYMEGKIAELISRQSTLAQRTSRLMPVLERAQKEGIAPSKTDPDGLPLPTIRPGNDRRASLAPALNAPSGVDRMTTGAIEQPESGVERLVTIRNTLTDMEAEQIEQIASLTEAAVRQRNDIIEVARSSGLPVSLKPIESIGGPYIPADQPGLSSASFETELSALEVALEALEDAQQHVVTFPIANPAPGRVQTSGFGKRKDPFLKKSAFHAGIDFRTPKGTPILATGHGKVIRAERAGGYGKLVEIQHAGGLTTRYAHLSKIRVKKGQTVTTGMRIGDAGSTGRSTGPHLHYEVRKDGKPINPSRYLKAGLSLRDKL